MRLTASFKKLSAAVQRQGFSTGQQMKVSAVTQRASPAFILRRAPGNWQFEILLALLALVLPGIILKNIPAGTKRCPGRGFHDIGTAAPGAAHFYSYRRFTHDFRVEDMPASLT
jgi:hypothetical protein